MSYEVHLLPEAGCQIALETAGGAAWTSASCGDLALDVGLVVVAHGDNCLMRINLVTPFAEKDAVKAIGARWDPAKKLWYITDVADLTPFMRWIPDLVAASEPSGGLAKSAAMAPAKLSPGVVTKSTVDVPHCGCKVLPWVDCEHSAAQENL